LRSEDCGYDDGVFEIHLRGGRMREFRYWKKSG
jgi:hypothetical protein